MSASHVVCEICKQEFRSSDIVHPYRSVHAWCSTHPDDHYGNHPDLGDVETLDSPRVVEQTVTEGTFEETDG